MASAAARQEPRIRKFRGRSLGTRTHWRDASATQAVGTTYRLPSSKPKILPVSARFTRESTLPATILDGKALAAQIEAELAEQVAEFIQNNGHEPTLAAVLVGDDPASSVYVKNKRSACERVG